MKRSKLIKEGFTLIELLVVISIISLLSSIVLSALNSARGKGEVAANQEMDASFNHSLADSLVGEWLFDEGGTPAKDTSGNGNNGVVIPGSPVASPAWITTNPFNRGFSLNANGGGISVGKNPALMPKKFTASAWIYATANTGPNGNFGRVLEKGGHSENGGYGIEFNANSGVGGVNTVYGVIWTASNGSTNTRVSPPDGSIQLNKWYFIIFSFDGSTGRFYINGIKKAEVPGLTMVPSDDLHHLTIGAALYGPAASNDRYFPGYIDSVRLYNRDLEFSEIQKLYAEGLSSHPQFASK